MGLSFKFEFKSCDGAYTAEGTCWELATTGRSGDWHWSVQAEHGVISPKLKNNDATNFLTLATGSKIRNIS